MKPFLRSRPSPVGNGKQVPGEQVLVEQADMGQAGAGRTAGPAGQAGLSLLQGLLVLAIIGLAVTFLLNQLS